MDSIERERTVTGADKRSTSSSSRAATFLETPPTERRDRSSTIADGEGKGSKIKERSELEEEIKAMKEGKAEVEPTSGQVRERSSSLDKKNGVVSNPGSPTSSWLRKEMEQRKDAKNAKVSLLGNQRCKKTDPNEEESPKKITKDKEEKITKEEKNDTKLKDSDESKDKEDKKRTATLESLKEGHDKDQAKIKEQQMKEISQRKKQYDENQDGEKSNKRLSTWVSSSSSQVNNKRASANWFPLKQVTNPTLRSSNTNNSNNNAAISPRSPTTPITDVESSPSNSAADSIEVWDVKIKTKESRPDIKSAEELKQKFQEATEAWLAHTDKVVLSSNTEDHLACDAFKDIIKMGDEVIEFIMEVWKGNSKASNLWWFFGLHEIVLGKKYEYGVRFSVTKEKTRWMRWWREYKKRTKEDKKREEDRLQKEKEDSSSNPAEDEKERRRRKVEELKKKMAK